MRRIVTFYIPTLLLCPCVARCQALSYSGLSKRRSWQRVCRCANHSFGTQYTGQHLPIVHRQRCKSDDTI